jgi:predicted component of type VI protein secretion system
VSKTHLEFGVDDRGFWVRDRGSTNGSAVVTPGGARQACPPGVTVHVAAGSTVLVGDREVRVDRS